MPLEDIMKKDLVRIVIEMFWQDKDKLCSLFDTAEQSEDLQETLDKFITRYCYYLQKRVDKTMKYSSTDELYDRMAQIARDISHESYSQLSHDITDTDMMGVLRRNLANARCSIVSRDFVIDFLSKLLNISSK